MCGRYFIEDDAYEIQQMLRDLDSRHCNDIKTGEVYPTNTAPILRRDGASAARWGFPRWDGSGVVINSRSETVWEKSMFRKSLTERRCVVPSTGFFEWNHADGKKKKDKYLLNRPGTEMFYMAGAWNTFKTPDGEYEAFFILTTVANESMTLPETELSLFPVERLPIHDRICPSSSGKASAPIGSPATPSRTSFCNVRGRSCA